MKPVVSRSCSCTSCLYHTNNQRPHLRKILDDNTKIDKLYIGKHIPSRQRKLISKLVRTRAIYDDIRAELFHKSDTYPRDKADFRLQKSVTTNAKDEVMPEFIAMIDNGLAPRINECGCCKCSSDVDVDDSSSRNAYPNSLQTQQEEPLSLRLRNQRLRELNAFMRSRIIERQRIERNLQLMRKRTAAARIAQSNMKGGNKVTFTETQAKIRPELQRRVNVSDKMQIRGIKTTQIMKKSFKDQSVQPDIETELSKFEKHTCVMNCVPEECLKMTRQKYKTDKLVDTNNISRRLNETQTRFNTSDITTQTLALGKTVQIGSEKITKHKTTTKEVTSVDINTDAIRLGNARIIGTNTMNPERISRSVHPIQNITEDITPRSVSTGTLANKIEKAISTIRISPETHKTNTNVHITDAQGTVAPVIQKNAIKLQIKEKKPKTKEVALAINYVKRVNKKTHLDSFDSFTKSKLLNQDTSQYAVQISKKGAKKSRKPAADQAIQTKTLKKHEYTDNRLGKQISRHSQGNLAKSFMKSKNSMRRCFCTATLYKRKILTNPVSASHAKGITIKRESALMRNKLYSLNRVVKSTSNIASSSSKISSRRRRKRVLKRSVLHKVASDNTRKTKDIETITAKNNLHEPGSQGDNQTQQSNMKSISVQPQIKHKNYISTTVAKCLKCIFKMQKNTNNDKKEVDNRPKRYSTEIPQNLKYHECEPNVCIPRPGDCDSKRCFQTLKLKTLPRDVRVAKPKSIANLSRTFAVGYTKTGSKQSRNSKKLVAVTITPSQLRSPTNSLQAVKIVSNFSFNVEFSKELQPQKYKQSQPSTKPVFSLDKRSDLKAVKPGNIYTVSRLEVATKKYLQNRTDTITKRFNKITRQTNTYDETSMLKLSLMNISSVSDLNILYDTHLFQVNKWRRKFFDEHIASTYTQSSTSFKQCLTAFTPYTKRNVCVMNVQNLPRITPKGYTIQTYECEPGICVPNPNHCDPRECLKLINKRLRRRDSISGTSSSFRSTSTHTSRDARGNKKARAGGFSYVFKPKSLTEQAQRSSIFNTTNKETDGTVSDAKARAKSPKQKKKTKRNKASNGATSKIRNSYQSQLDLITTASSVMSNQIKRCMCILKSNQNLDKSNGESNRDFESHVYISNRTSRITPMLKRCFCTLKLQKMGRNEMIKPDKHINTHTNMTDQPRRRQVSAVRNIPNTKRQSIHTYNLNEDKPYVCMPGECDPYKYLELIKMRKRTDRHQETGSFVSISVDEHRGASSRVGRKSIPIYRKYPPRKKLRSQGTSYKKDSGTSTDNLTRRLSRQVSSQVSEKKSARQDVIISKCTPSAIKKYERLSSNETSEKASTRRQTVRIGSSFNFNIELCKERIPTIKTVDVELKARPNKAKTKTAGMKDDESSGSVSHDWRDDDSQSSVDQTGSRSTDHTDILKRCFCTLKLLKKNKKATKKDKAITQGTNTPPIKVPLLYEKSTQDRPHNKDFLHDKDTQKKNSRPHRCGPGVCVHECHPYECERILKEIGTTTKPIASIISSVKSTVRPKKYDRHSHKEYFKTNPAQSSAVIVHQKNKSREAVQLGSSFSFNIKFHKDRYIEPSFPRRYATYSNPHEYNNMLEQQKIKEQHPTHYMSESRSNTKRDPQRIKSTAASLKRCFCTLALQKPRQDPVIVYQVTDLISNKQHRTDNNSEQLNGREAALQPPPVHMQTRKTCTTRQYQKHERNLQILTRRVKSSVSRVSPFLQHCIKRTQIAKAKLIEKHNEKSSTSQNVNNTNREVKLIKSSGYILKRCIFGLRNKIESLTNDTLVERSLTSTNAKKCIDERNITFNLTCCESELKKTSRNGFSENNKFNGAEKFKAVDGPKATGIVPLLKKNFWAMRVTPSHGKNTANKSNKPKALSLNNTNDIVSGAKGFKALQKSNVSDVGPYECPPRFCVPGACDMYDCLERLRKRKRQTTGTKTTISAGTGNRSVKKVQTESRQRPAQNVQTSTKALHEKTCNTCQLSRQHVVEEPRFPTFSNVNKHNRQTVRISSDFRFNVEVFKDSADIIRENYDMVRMNKKDLKSKLNTLSSGNPKTVDKSCGTNYKNQYYLSSKFLNTQLHSEEAKVRHVLEDGNKKQQNYKKGLENSITFQESSKNNKKLRENQISNTKDVITLLPYKSQKFNNKSSKTVVRGLFLCDNKCCAKRNVHKRYKNMDFQKQSTKNRNNISGAKYIVEMPPNGWNVKKICNCLTGLFSKAEKYTSVSEIKDSKSKKNKKSLISTDYLKSSKSDRQSINLSPKAKQSKSMRLVKTPDRRIRQKVFYFEQERAQYSKWQSGDTSKILKHASYKSYKHPHDIIKKPETQNNEKQSIFHKEHTVQLAMITQNKKFCDKKIQDVESIKVDNAIKTNKGDSRKRDPNSKIQEPHASVCKSKNPCKCCLGSKEKKATCVTECKTVTKKDPKTKTTKPKPDQPECSHKPLFDMTMETETLKILNRDQIYDRVMSLKPKTTSVESLKLHGASCECCFCRGKRKAKIVQSKLKKSPCICGSKKCEEIYTRQEMEKKRIRDLKKKKKCVCGSKICAGDSVNPPVKHKVVDKSNIKKVKKKGLTSQQKAAQNAKAKKSRKTSDLRQKRHKKEDALRRKRQLQEDKLALKQLRKYKNSGNVTLCAESVIDVLKFVLTSTARMLRCFCRSITDPKLTFQKTRDAIVDPEHALTSVYHVISDSGVRPTVKRVGIRMGYMPCVKAVASKMEYCSNSRLRTQSTKRIRKRDPVDFECSLYMASLRKRPHLWVFYKCRWFYPHCVGLMNILRQFTDVCLFMLAVVVWSPCIIAMELCRTSMCCTMCTA